MGWFNERLTVTLKIADRLWFRIALSVWGAVAFYDTVVSQFVPESLAKRFPKMYELITETGGWLPYWGWLLALATIMAAACFEYAVRKTRVRPSTLVSPRIELSATIVRAQEGSFPAKYIQAAVHAVGNLLGCQVMLNEVARIEGNAVTVVYNQPLHAGWSGTPETSVDVNDGQGQRANLFSVSMVLNSQKYLLVPQTRHRDEALRLAVAAPGFYRLTVLASSKTTAAMKKDFMLWWGGSFDDVELREGDDTWAERDRISLFEAATRAYEQTRNDPISILAGAFSDMPNYILTWYCDTMTRHERGKPPLVTLSGNSPPARVVEEVDIAPLRRYKFVVKNDTIILQEQNGSMRFENLSARSEQVADAIRKLKRREV
jgi:hypothetical protein